MPPEDETMEVRTVGPAKWGKVKQALNIAYAVANGQEVNGDLDDYRETVNRADEQLRALIAENDSLHRLNEVNADRLNQVRKGFAEIREALS